ncbi:MAG: hypothetical protein HRT36_05735 [Alphaproteobacteria bacterium]|nr:hypothetical protein [Alphaproteobacteria bacterium]
MTNDDNQDPNIGETDLRDEADLKIAELAPEERAKREGYVEFCGRIVNAKTVLSSMEKSLHVGKTDEVLDAWQPLKVELDHLNTMALQLNKGGFGPMVREQLQSLLDECKDIHQKVTDYDESPDSAVTRAQKTQKAYRSIKQRPE